MTKIDGQEVNREYPACGRDYTAASGIVCTPRLVDEIDDAIVYTTNALNGAFTVTLDQWNSDLDPSAHSGMTPDARPLAELPPPRIWATVPNGVAPGDGVTYVIVVPVQDYDALQQQIAHFTGTQATDRALREQTEAKVASQAAELATEREQRVKAEAERDALRKSDEWKRPIQGLLFALGMKQEMAGSWGGDIEGWGAAFEWIKYHVKRSQSNATAEADNNRLRKALEYVLDVREITCKHPGRDTDTCCAKCIADAALQPFDSGKGGK